MKWLGVGAALLGLVAFALFGFLGLMWAEPPVEAPWLLRPPSKAGSVQTEVLPAGAYSFAVMGLGPKDKCMLTARNPRGDQVFREVELEVAGEGCRAYATAKSGDVWDLAYEPPTARVVVYTSHGDGFPHVGKLLLAALTLILGGIVVAIWGFVRDAKQRQRS